MYLIVTEALIHKSFRDQTQEEAVKLPVQTKSLKGPYLQKAVWLNFQLYVHGIVKTGQLYEGIAKNGQLTAQ